MAARGTGDPNGTKLPPFRNMQDFCLDSARFQVPPFNDQERWANRVVNNLLYYQTNYFTILLAAVLLIGIMSASNFLYGFIGTLCLMMAIVMGTSKHHAMRELRRSKMWAFVLAEAFLAYSMYSLLRPMAIFAFPFAISVACIFVHASLRTRNLKNRVVNKMEQLGVKRSPMGILMGMTGYEVQLRAEDLLDELKK
ncbi:hypothetical protein RvY_04998-2 [Ramazzottius varieornatus]|uniref:PRA1 family protein n=1 Tax=Ramazzottius varieornatus TaxID=947166 RepID=A0A1D1UTI5_RAMVA|nr:hypothetical protein RvY_04998-2 [Ramazzottius varieornatus]